MTVTDVPEIHFPGGLPGFPNLERYALIRWGDESSPFALLQSLDDAVLATFVVVPPNMFFPEYEPEIGDDTVTDLGIETADDVLLLSIVTVAEPVETSTVNLLGPLVINVHKKVGLQAILDPDRYATAARISGD